MFISSHVSCLLRTPLAPDKFTSHARRAYCLRADLPGARNTCSLCIIVKNTGFFLIKMIGANKFCSALSTIGYGYPSSATLHWERACYGDAFRCVRGVSSLVRSSQTKNLCQFVELLVPICRCVRDKTDKYTDVNSLTQFGREVECIHVNLVYNNRSILHTNIHAFMQASKSHGGEKLFFDQVRYNFYNL